MNQESMRPRDYALLLLASGDLRPRKRARDQQADVSGLQLQRRMLESLAAIDPEPDDMESALIHIIEEIGPPTGPARALAIMVYQEWRQACENQEIVRHLLERATTN